MAVQIPNHDRHGELRKEHAVVVKPEPTANHVQSRVDVLDRAFEGVGNLTRPLRMKMKELRLAG